MSAIDSTSSFPSQHDPSAPPKGDHRRLIKTRYPGVYKRVTGDGRAVGYVAIFRAGGKQRKRLAKTLDEARRIKRESETDDGRGEFAERSTLVFSEYLRSWVETYQGNGRRGFREGTRAEYRRLLDAFALEFFSPRLRLCDVKPTHLRQFIAWVLDEREQGRALSDSTLRNALNPIRAALTSAHGDGLIRHNPAARLVIPVRDRVEEDEDEQVKALSRDQLAQLVTMTPTRYRLLVKLIASTGLRVSEAVGLQVRHLELDGSRPHVRVRRAVVKRRVEPPKTRYGRREVPLPAGLVSELRAQVTGLADQSSDGLVFPSSRATPLDPDTMRRDVLQALMQEIGASGLGFHALRHTYASLQLANGVNVLQLSRALGHHSAAFTLSVYTHLLPGDEAPPLDLTDVLGQYSDGGNDAHGSRANSPTPLEGLHPASRAGSRAPTHAAEPTASASTIGWATRPVPLQSAR